MKVAYAENNENVETESKILKFKFNDRKVEIHQIDKIHNAERKPH